jgi:hypothetical protein
VYVHGVAAEIAVTAATEEEVANSEERRATRMRIKMMRMIGEGMERYITEDRRAASASAAMTEENALKTRSEIKNAKKAWGIRNHRFYLPVINCANWRIARGDEKRKG